MKEIEFLQYLLRGEFATRMNADDIDEILKVLQLATEKIEHLHTENQWLYGKLIAISDIIKQGREEIPKI